MNLVVSISDRRLFWAIALSVMVHAVVLWLPYFHLPHEKPHLPPLSVQLDPLPASAEQPAAKSESLYQSSKSAPIEEPAAKSEALNLASKSDNTSSGKSIDQSANRLSAMEKLTATKIFPRHVQLTFAVYRGATTADAGELRHQLDIDKTRYAISAEKIMTSKAGLLNKDQLFQTSEGSIGEHGLHPEAFTEEKISKGGRQILKNSFDWKRQKLRLSRGNEIALPDNAQDSLSFLYQLSLQSRHTEYFWLPVSDGRQLNEYQIEFGISEDVSTPMGKLPALRLRRVHAPGEAYFEIWLGRDFGLLPVRFRQLDASENVIEEFVISDIQVSD